jgi:hypothetical protein
MIRISQLIKELQQFEKKYGNLPVLMREDGMGGHAMIYVSGVDKSPTRIHPSDFEDVDDNEPKVLALFPDWDGEPESLLDSDMKSVKCVEIGIGEMLFAT